MTRVRQYLPILYALPALGLVVCLASPDWWMPFGGEHEANYVEVERKVSPDGRLVAWVGHEMWGGALGGTDSVVAVYPVGVGNEDAAIREGTVFESSDNDAVLSVAWLDARTLSVTTTLRETRFRRSNAFVQLGGERARVRVLYNDEAMVGKAGKR